MCIHRCISETRGVAPLRVHVWRITAGLVVFALAAWAQMGSGLGEKTREGRFAPKLRNAQGG